MAKDSAFIRKIALAFSVPLCAMVYGADVTIPSTYDEASGTWIGDVAALTNAIMNTISNQKIFLSKGVYDLSPLTNAPLYNANGTGYGAALICSRTTGVKFIGATGDPADVVITAKDSTYRLICLNANKSELHDVTVMGGYASTDHIGTWAYQRGGGVFLGSGSAVVSNCVFAGNRAHAGGGAVAGPARTGTVYDSVFRDNNESHYATAAYGTTLYNCVFTNNHSVGDAKEAWTGSVAESCHVYDSYFAHNHGGRTGGVSGCLAVNCTFEHNRQENINGNNWGNPGGGAAYDSILSNCTFYGNSAYRLGGAIRGGTVVNCTVISNATRHASDAYGGGIYKAVFVEGCTVSSNVSVYGGGVSHGSVVDTDILYNKAKAGGGARSSVLTDCVISHNVATDYGNGNYGGAGGGISYGAATNCVFRDNSCSSAHQAASLSRCDIGDTSINAKEIDSCVIHDMKNASMARAVGNVAYPDGFVTSNVFMIGGCDVARNCLVTNCVWESIKGSYVNAAMFEPERKAITTCVENCSFIANHIYLTARNYSTPTQTIAFVNSVFYARPDSDRKDVSRLSSKYMVLSNCVYETIETAAVAEGFENSGCLVLPQTDCRFTGKEPHPFAMKRSSPLRGTGLLLDWMENGTDLLGKPRLRDGKVDVGCYQCWLDPIGTVFSVR